MPKTLTALPMSQYATDLDDVSGKLLVLVDAVLLSGAAAAAEPAAATVEADLDESRLRKDGHTRGMRRLKDAADWTVKGRDLGAADVNDCAAACRRNGERLPGRENVLVAVERS